MASYSLSNRQNRAEEENAKDFDNRVGHFGFVNGWSG